jgi:hypothetical protein
MRKVSKSSNLLHSLVLILATIGWIWALSFAALGQSCTSGAHGREVISGAWNGAGADACPADAEQLMGSWQAASKGVCFSASKQ